VAPTIPAAPCGGYQLGFRVPLIFVSAYTKAGYINNERHDFGDILRFVEHNFGLQAGALAFADGRSSYQLADFYDFDAGSTYVQVSRWPKAGQLLHLR
jgi:phospholipase C